MEQINELPDATQPTPILEKRKVSRGRPKNRDVRAREYLTEAEVERLMDATKKSQRYALRDRTLVLLMYRHGLRCKEAVQLRWSQIDFDTSVLATQRAKNGIDTTHPLRGIELRALRELRRANPRAEYVFISERGDPMVTGNVRKIVTRLARTADFEFPVHPHMLRHACGYKLANEGRDTRAIQHYLGHKNIAHTVRYTELSPDRFKDFWND